MKGRLLPLVPLLAVVAELPQAAASDPPLLLSPPASSSDSLEEAVAAGVAFLVADQNPDGSWGSARQTKGLNVYAPVPGAHEAFRLAVTAMAVTALIESGLADSGGEAAEALAAGEAYLLERLPRVRRATADAIYNVWTHAYGIRALVAMHARAGSPGERERILAAVNGQIDRLARYESVDGGWGYYDFRAGTARPASSAISFTTATCLVSLHEALSLEGVVVPEGLSERALASILRQRKPDHSYLYGEYLWQQPMRGINRPAGSLARSQACNYALRLWGDETVTGEVVAEWLDRLFDRNGWLDIGRKRPVPHETWFQIAGYFFYYGHYYAARCLELLPPSEREPRRAALAAILVDLQEGDGSWWDFPLYSYHQPYGTAYAVMSLARCRPGFGVEGRGGPN